MTAEKSRDPDMLRQLLDAIPFFVLAVDENLRIIQYNQAAGTLLDLKKENILHLRGGETFGCSSAGDGCGNRPECKSCPVLEAVREAYAGTSHVRRRARMDLIGEGKVRRLNFLITASPFTYKGQKTALLILEDIRDLVELQQLVPICAWCKKVRDDDAYWKQVDAYLSHHLDMKFTHGICPDCAKSRMEE